MEKRLVTNFSFPSLPECPEFTKNPDKEVMVMQVIRTTNATRGNGTEASPFRRITQYWSMDGELLAERDPCPASAGEKP
jgi:hypothetical protein